MHENDILSIRGSRHARAGFAAPGSFCLRHGHGSTHGVRRPKSLAPGLGRLEPVRGRVLFVVHGRSQPRQQRRSGQAGTAAERDGAHSRCGLHQEPVGARSEAGRRREPQQTQLWTGKGGSRPLGKRMRLKKKRWPRSMPGRCGGGPCVPKGPQPEKYHLPNPSCSIRLAVHRGRGASPSVHGGRDQELQRDPPPPP
ncbi:hypothetical protein GQ53DRAFT_2125 [Thozetella sp. PMI_491]|nr:hypothetical protein GQ53DRAFT_2125 [Thozetella sp. PMI_491]